MKRICLSIVFLMMGICAVSAEGLSVRVLVPQEDIPEEARKLLSAKLTQIASNYGVADGLADRFVLTADVLVSTKDIVPSAPPRISQKLDVILYLGDIVDDKVYSSISLPVIGVGQNENKAYINAFQRIPVRSSALSEWMEGTKRKMEDYYEQNADAILARADYLTKTGEWDAAIASLLSVPDICPFAETAREKALQIRQDKIDAEGRDRCAEARNRWMAGQDTEAAAEALALLAEVNVDSSAAKEAEALAASINRQLASRKSRIEAQKNREWEFRMKQYEDDLELRRQQAKDQASVERAKADAIKSASDKIAGIDVNKVIVVLKGWFRK